jgi:hypothetical protein
MPLAERRAVMPVLHALADAAVDRVFVLEASTDAAQVCVCVSVCVSVVHDVWMLQCTRSRMVQRPKLARAVTVLALLARAAPEVLVAHATSFLPLLRLGLAATATGESKPVAVDKLTADVLADVCSVYTAVIPLLGSRPPVAAVSAQLEAELRQLSLSMGPSVRFASRFSLFACVCSAEWERDWQWGGAITHRWFAKAFRRYVR